MQRSAIKNQLSQQLEELKKEIAYYEQQDNHTPEDAERLLKQIEGIYRRLAVYQHSLKSSSTASELDVHLKIIQAVEKKEEAKVEVKIPREEKQVRLEIPDAKEIPMEEKKKGPVEPSEETLTINVKKIELGINDKYRIINELFGQQTAEFNAALQQLNSIENWISAQTYMNSLKSVYDWKDEDPLVKTFYTLVQKRFI
ncbi:MAG: hypothetical protein ACJ76F_08510 [Bacteroidia bacterium]